MTTALSRMLIRKGKSMQDFCGRKAKGTRLGGVFRRHGVLATSELERIRWIPRRRWQDDPEILTREITAWLRQPEGKQVLWDAQAVALSELHDFGGVFCPIAVGMGKTLVSFLAPTVIDAKRPLLLVPAKLARKTRREFALLAAHWRVNPGLEIMSYELLSRDRGGRELERIAPDLIISDECHRLKNKSAGSVRKVVRWMKEHPDTRFAAMSGTITSRSLREYAHILAWCRPQHSPLPDNWGELQDWADALDANVDPLARLAPGALLSFCTVEEVEKSKATSVEATQSARAGFQRRLTETPGVVATDEKQLGTSLRITGEVVRLGAPAQAALKRLRDDWETPDGHPVTEAVDLWRHAREISCDFYYRWDPPAPADWMAARRAWAKFVREVLGRHRAGYDTEFQVARGCILGQVDDGGIYQAWVEIRSAFVPNTVPVWLGDTMLKYAAAWLKKNPGLCWTEHVAFAERLSERTGVTYFGPQGQDKRGRAIEETEPGPAIVSIAANSEGRNLQAWNQNLIVSLPGNGRILEQLIGRTHRPGQLADEVSVDIAFACTEHWGAFQAARRDAEYIQRTTGQPQKLLYADVDLPDVGEGV